MEQYFRHLPLRRRLPRPRLKRKEQIEAIRQYLANEKVENIALSLGHCRTTIQRLLKRFGVPRRPSGGQPWRTS